MPEDKKNQENEADNFGSELENELSPINTGKIFQANKIQIPEKQTPSEEPLAPSAVVEKQPSSDEEIPLLEKEPSEPEIDDEFLKMIDEYMPRAEEVEVGDIMEVPVLDVRADCVLVNIGDKMEGMVDISEFMTRNGEVTVTPGDVIEVMIEGRDEQSDQVVLSHRKAVRRIAIERLSEAVEKKSPIRGRVTDVVKGGLIVDVGIACFMPASQIDRSRIENMNSWVGREVEAYVIDFNLERQRAILSRRKLMVENLEKRKKALLDGLKVGDIRTVRVKSIHDFGAFVELGPMDGFIPRDEVSHERGAHPAMYLKEDHELKVKVIVVDKEAQKVTLSRKQARLDPWEKVGEKYPKNSIVTGRVASIASFGAFVQLEEGLTGMIHVSNLSWEKGTQKPDEFMKEGDIVKAVVLDFDKENHKLALGLKQITEDPWVKIEGKFTLGSRVKGIVTSLTDFGAFVRLDENVEGLIHISNMTWDKKPGRPSLYLKAGQEVETLVLNTNREGRRISLGLRQLQKSPIDLFLESHKVGNNVEGVVTRIASFGAFVEIADGIEGLLHVSEISPERVDNPSSVLKEGQRIKCKIINIASGGRRISLSRKEVIRDEDKKAMQAYLKSNVKGGVNVGELLKELKNKLAR